MKYCKDCGCVLEKSGICSNCHEELFILTYQGEDMMQPPSDEFIEKAADQSRKVKEADDE